MRSILPILGALAVTLASATDVTLRIIRSPNCNTHTLPPSSHATLTTLGKHHSALLTPAGEFVFHNVSEGSYLADVHCSTHAFSPVRIDVAVGGGDEAGEKVVVEAWETYRGNSWGNKGEVMVGEGGSVGVRCLGGKNYFIERPTFSVFSILKNPMILLALVSMGLFVGMPYLVDNMDPEMRAEFEERQKSNPMNSLLSGQPSSGNPIADFDMAGYLAGSKKEKNGGGSRR
ncbi:uncharacterized protein DNG_06505 [Cephalotrichum gorgonifer]|uniref:ER membrane protein complex subunit 7 beta-sandwich domain-containing protein n=1 Tax=Cephalotrichum gorgonifer TaxID=2041049 RepID=A0AAE8N2W9_9PEZI|nr:uncharacterized protein DNG_06505 [Cephalotrichum gorgonifer]